MIKILAVGLIVTNLITGLAHGQTNAPSTTPEEIHQAARIALAQGVAWFKARATNDPDGWLSPPGRIRRFTGYTNVVVRYKMMTVDQAIFEYTNVVTFAQGSVGQAPQKIVQQIAVRQIGTKKVETPVADPNGPLTKEDRYPVYEQRGATYWRFSNVGDAAMAMYALRRAGVPDSDPVMDRMISNLEQYLHTYGLPDQTWNLAWLTAVMAGTPGKEAADWTQKLAARILDGQITDGAARGLWGPDCFHPGLLAAYLREYLVLIAEHQKRELKQKKSPDSHAAQDALDQAQSDMNHHKDLMDAITRQALRFVNAEIYWSWDPNADPPVSFGGATHFFYNQTAADLESTSIALFGLSVAAEYHRLPAQSIRSTQPAKLPTLPSRTPTATGTGMQLPPPEQANAVLARAANALAGQQEKDGRWNECNLHQPVTDFDAFTSTLPVPADPKSFPPLPSPTTPVSVAQGLAALDSIGHAVGTDRLFRDFKAPYLNGLSAEQKEFKSFLQSSWPSPAAPTGLTPADFNLYLALARPFAAKGADAELQAVNDELTRLLVLGGHGADSWGHGVNAWFIPTSTAKRFEVLSKIPSRVWYGGSPVEMNKAHLWYYNGAVNGQEDSPAIRDGEGFATAAAILYLASRVENPSAAIQELANSPLPQLRKEAELQLLGKGPPKPAPAAPAAPTTASPAAPPAPAKPPPEVEGENDIPALPAKPAETKPKTDESF